MPLELRVPDGCVAFLCDELSLYRAVYADDVEESPTAARRVAVLTGLLDRLDRDRLFVVPDAELARREALAALREAADRAGEERRWKLAAGLREVLGEAEAFFGVVRAGMRAG